MKKVMLLIVGLMFAGSVSAASLDLSTFDQDVATNASNISITNTSVSAVSFNDITAAGAFDLGHHIVAAVDQWVEVEWSFNKAINLTSASISKGGSFALVESITGAGAVFTMFLMSGVDYYFDISGVSAGNPLTATLSIVSAVPVPAALFLFAPALLGFFGLRRKAAVAA
ncbi:MAG: hypothetical protein P1U35_04855 [Cycloclasticus sp.]|nr:hypothetical protein [Cycloclasticus sp.]